MSKKEIILFILLIIQPFLDVLSYFTLNTKYSIFAFLLRALILFLSSLYILFNTKDRKYFIFLIVIAVFDVTHLLVSYKTSNFSIIEDVKEMIRVEYLPILAINLYLFIKNSKISMKPLISGIITNTFIIFGIIILGLIVGNCPTTYAEGVGLRGWFYNSNSQSIILCFIVPYTLFHVLKSTKLYYIVPTIIISFFLLYTNGTTFCYLMIFPTFLISLYQVIISKTKNVKKFFLIVLLLIPITFSILFYNYSPDKKISSISDKSFSNTIKEYEKGTTDNYQKNENNNIRDSKLDKDIENEDLEIIVEQLPNGIDVNAIETINHYFNKNFIQKYGYNKILEKFGKNFDLSHLVNNRYRKKIVAKVIYDESNFAAKLVGFEFGLINYYGVDLENDYSAIFYYYGIIGFMLYISLFIYIFYILIKKAIKNPKILFDPDYLLLFGLYLALNVSAEYSGALLRRPNASIYMVVLIAMIMIKYGEEKNEAKRSKKCNI